MESEMNIDATAESNILDMTDDNDIEECEKIISNKPCDHVDPKKLISSSGKTEEIVDKEEEKFHTTNQIVQKYLDVMKQDIIRKNNQSLVPVVWDPDIELVPKFIIGAKPNVNDFYLKKVYRCIPHRNICGFRMDQLKCGSCNNQLYLHGWNRDSRCIYDVSGIHVAVFYNYKCKNDKCEYKGEMNIASTNTREELKMSMPDIYWQYYSDITLRKCSGYTRKFIQNILDDAMTSKTFYSIAEGIKSLRYQEYLRKRELYYSFVRSYVDTLVTKNISANDEALVTEIASVDDFSAMHDKACYNEMARPTDNYIIDVFERFVEDMQPIFDEYIENIPVDKTMSIDFTHNVMKRQFQQNSRTKKNMPIDQKAFLTITYGNGQVAFVTPTTIENQERIVEGVKRILNKAKKQKKHPPQIVWLDNCCDHREVIQKAYEVEGFGAKYARENKLPLDRKGKFPVVAVDTKHLINRLLEQCNQKSTQYVDFSVDIHNAFCDKTKVVLNGIQTSIPNRLLPSATIWKNINNIISTVNINGDQLCNHVPLFKGDFKKTLENQHKHFQCGCVYDFPTNELDENGNYPFDIKDPSNNWYVKLNGGKYILRRGTNKNESYHKRLNAIFPEKCGEKLANCIFTCYAFQHAIQRECNIPILSGGISVFNYAQCKNSEVQLDKCKELIRARASKLPAFKEENVKLLNAQSVVFSNTNFEYNSNSTKLPNNDYSKTLNQKSKGNRNDNLQKRRKREETVETQENTNSEEKTKRKRRFTYDDCHIQYLIDECNKLPQSEHIDWYPIHEKFIKEFPDMNGVDKDNLRSAYQYHSNRVQRSLNINNNNTKIKCVYYDADEIGDNDNENSSSNMDNGDSKEDEINNVATSEAVSLPSGEGIFFTKDEDELLKNLAMKYTSSISWKNLQFNFNLKARSLRNEGKIVYYRTQEQLHNRYKYFMKIRKEKEKKNMIGSCNT
jgi:hypothetical protein